MATVANENKSTKIRCLPQLSCKAVTSEAVYMGRSPVNMALDHDSLCVRASVQADGSMFPQTGTFI